jgi:uncharacterized protein YkwD
VRSPLVPLLALALLSAFASGCAESQLAPKSEPDVQAPRTIAAQMRKIPGWAEATRSPSSDESARAQPPEACGAPDEALAKLAAEIADERSRGKGTPEPDAITARMRAAGVPHPRPRVLTASGHAPLVDDAVRAKLASLRSDARLTRCGVATAQTPHGGEVLVALAVDALADLSPLPLRARTGEWLSFDARLRVPARGATLVVLGPRGAPRTVPTSLDSRGRALARFALDGPGSFLVQLVADTDGGPRPLLEARVFSDVDPPATPEVEPAPGEEAAAPASDDAGALAGMIGALRHEEGLTALARDERLDGLALAHAEKMRASRTVAHDLGDGDLRARFEAANLDAKTIGENVAHAETVALAHRALHASPSHRMNLLRADYTHVGLAVLRAQDGSVYVCQVFAARAGRQADALSR